MRRGRETFEIYCSDGHYAPTVNRSPEKAAQLIATELGYKSFEELKPILNPDKAINRMGEEERNKLEMLERMGVRIETIDGNDIITINERSLIDFHHMCGKEFGVDCIFHYSVVENLLKETKYWTSRANEFHTLGEMMANRLKKIDPDFDTKKSPNN